MDDEHLIKGSIQVEREEYRLAEEFQSARDLNLRPIAYTIFASAVLFIAFISYLISEHP